MNAVERIENLVLGGGDVHFENFGRSRA